jgi:site-specific DNA-methyltransferase (adenine-specific)
MEYPKDYINQIIQGDCLEVMKGIPDKSIDLILTDPPYGINFKSAWQTYQKRIENDGFNDWLEILPKFLTEFKRILTDTGCCCCCGGGGKTPVTALFTIEAIKHFNLIQTLIWRKFIGVGWKYRPSYETILVLSKSKDNYNFYDTSKKCSNVIEGINQEIPCKGKHPTVKPVRLMKHLIEIHSNKDDLILDPFLGSGTTAVACKELGRRYIGIEISPEYCEIARNRVNAIPERLF